MEARRTFQGGVTSSKPNWIVVVALIAALLLAAVSVYLAKGMSSVSSVSSASAPAATHVVTSLQPPDALDRNAEILAARQVPTEQQIIDSALAGIKPFRESHGH
jgi:hypothetical protein